MKGLVWRSLRAGEVGAIFVLVLSGIGATGVAPSQSELKTMYERATRELEAGHYNEALRQLDAIDARQPDLAVSQNLRGVTLMREGQYEKAEAVLRKAREIEPEFLDSRFNLAEVAFLKKNWAEARNQFEALLASSSGELEERMARLIQYKILLTFVLENKESSRVPELLGKLERWEDSPALDYAKAAIALHHQKKEEAGEWMTAAEKQFSPQLNKLFLESFYEVGWMQRPAGEAWPAFEFASATQTEADVRANFENAKQAFQQGDLGGALKFLDLCDQSAPNQAASLNLRGEILTAQSRFDEAEAALQKALEADPASWDAKYNLALVPFKRKDYATARARLEALLGETPAEGKHRSERLIQYQIFLAFLLEGKESAAQKTMDQFKFTDDTPALYYAQAAWGFQHNNPKQADEWVSSARKLFSPALNSAFADSFDDLGWLGTHPSALPAPTESSKSTDASSPRKPAQDLLPNPANSSSAPLVAENRPEITPTIAPTPVALAEVTPETARIAPANETSPAVSASPGKESLGSSSQESLGEAKKTRRHRDVKSAAAKTKASAARPTATPLPSASPTQTPRRPFLKRLARTLLRPFSRRTPKDDSDSPNQPGSSKPASSAPMPVERSGPQN